MATDLLIYLAAFAAPFVQEDAAVWGAVSAFEHPATGQMADGRLILLSMIVGLVLSDLWKYWIGYFGRHHAWAKKMTQKPAVSKVKARLLAHPGVTLMIVRFVPGTRIPAYLAAGLFGVPFLRFAFWIVASALAYVLVAWGLLHTVGRVAGESAKLYLAGGIILALCMYLGFQAVRKREPA
jgi:membrane protein DedA with SNARE-associated domain